MRNPWLDLPSEAPFVLPGDAQKIDAFNREASDSKRIHLNLLPEPFLGSPDAPIVLLSLNPGFSPDDALSHSDATFAGLSRDNLEHRASDHPFYLLNPRITAPGRLWWELHLRGILTSFPRSVVASRMACVEYFGYHSSKFNHSSLRLQSQEYSYFLVRQALRRSAIIVLTRGRRIWLDAVPDLESYPHLYTLRSQRMWISPNNCPEGFDKISAVFSGAIGPSAT
jgi:hypothetical protein